MNNKTRREILQNLGLALFGCSCADHAWSQNAGWPTGRTSNHTKPDESRVLGESRNSDDHNWGKFRRAGCTFRSNAGGSGGGMPPVSIYSGNPGVDQAYQREGEVLVEHFEVKPAGGFFNDGSEPNAFATPHKYFTNSYDGTVVFGVNLIDKELRRDRGRGLSVPAIMAHEFAHVLQFTEGSLTNVATPVRELHADFLAGWYMAQRNISEDLMRPAFEAFFTMGDYEYTSPNHHGNPDQRLGSLMHGYADGSSNVTDAFQSGLQHVASIL